MQCEDWIAPILLTDAMPPTITATGAQQPTRPDTIKLIPLPGVTVSVLRAGATGDVAVETQVVREANPRDAGELLRKLPGLDAVRRGPLGLDPVVRGLHETQVAVFLDGARKFCWQ